MAGKPFFTYKGRPLVRKGDILYYGHMQKPYIAMLQVKEQKQVGDISVATKVLVQKMATDTSLPPDQLITNKSERPGLYEALDLADVWLTRMENQK